MESHQVDDDDDDEFEPLFDYQGVCRPTLDDDSDEEVAVIDCKTWQDSTKCAGTGVPSLLNSGKRSDKETEDDCDWLPPPPKSAKVTLDAKISEDPTFLQLRQEREELMMLTAASEAALKKSATDIKGHTVNSEQVDCFADCTQKVVAAGKREKVLVFVQDKDGICKGFKVFMEDKFEKLFMTYAESVHKSPQLLIFSFDGQQIAGDNTPNDLGIENEDIIEVNMRT